MKRIQIPQQDVSSLANLNVQPLISYLSVSTTRMASPSKFSPLLFFHRLDHFTSMRYSSYSRISPLFWRNSRMFSSGPYSGEVEDASSQPSDSPSKLVLYSYWQSSCSWRVRFALNLKGLSYEYRAVDLSKREQFDPEFEKLNPLRYVPVLIDSGHTVISDSYAILLYLEEKYPKCQLLPLNPQLRAINLQVASIVSSSIQPLHMISLLNYIEERFGPDERESWAQHNIGKGFYALEKLLSRFAGKHATGDQLYLADVFLAPQIAVASERFKIDMLKFPTLNSIYQASKELPEFHASSPQKQPDAVALM